MPKKNRDEEAEGLSRAASTEQNLREIGVPNLAKFTACIQEPRESEAFVRELPGYDAARQSAIDALLKLYSQTSEPQVGFSEDSKTFKTGKPFEYELGKFRTGQGFITEGPDSEIHQVIRLGNEVKGRGTLKEISQALHNAEKLKDPKPQWLRDLNWERVTIVSFWVSEHLWLMKDETIVDWFNRKARCVRPTGIIRQTVSRMIKELGLKKSLRPIVKEMNKAGQFVFLSIANG